MKTKILILFAIFSSILVSCNKDMKWINPDDSKADQAEILKICEEKNAECGQIEYEYFGKIRKVFCGECENGYECRAETNKCEKTDESGKTEQNDEDQTDNNPTDDKDSINSNDEDSQKPDDDKDSVNDNDEDQTDNNPTDDKDSVNSNDEDSQKPDESNDYDSLLPEESDDDDFDPTVITPDDDVEFCDITCPTMINLEENDGCLKNADGTPKNVNEYTEGLCNGQDDDCDGKIDEGCPCTSGTTQACFSGKPVNRGIGTCRDGIQTCNSLSGDWGDNKCLDEILPTKDLCDHADNNCNGCADEGLCCEPPIDCTYDMGTAQPFIDKIIDGKQIYDKNHLFNDADTSTWEWTLSKGPCDIVLNKTSFTTKGAKTQAELEGEGEETTVVSGIGLSQFKVKFKSSGSYILHLKVTRPNGDVYECEWILHVVSNGLRVELCWDKTGTVDLDLYLGKNGVSTSWRDNNTCYYDSCKGNNWKLSGWGYAATENYNHANMQNPRLYENFNTPGLAEEIYLDNPNNGDTFRVMVNYYSMTGNILTHPVVNIYCGGTLRAVYGGFPSDTDSFYYDINHFDRQGASWKVVEIKWDNDSCELTPRMCDDGSYIISQGEIPSYDSWNSSECVSDTRNSQCTNLPTNAEWNTASSITQTWTSANGWQPSTTGVYNETASTEECHFKCNNTHYWHNSECTSPCDSNPCNSVSNSDKVCTASAWNEYTCGCESGYHWRGTELGCTDERLSIGNICTGQNKCYNNEEEITCPASPSGTDDEYNFYGQDAQHTNKCTAQSFTVSSDVIVDNNTGLTWEKSPSIDAYMWDNRATHCNELNSSNYGGKSNWRVPNPFELLTIVDNSTYNLATNSNFTNMPAENDSSLWTNSEYKGDPNHAYHFIPYYGWSWYDGTKTDPHKVLCVSGEEIKPAVSDDFTISSDGKTVTDSRTGLMWKKEYETNKTWQQALEYCQSLNAEGYGGYSTGWRLPNKNELASLINYEKSGPPYSYFPDMSTNYFLSSSTYLGSLSGAWIVHFYYGLARSLYKTAPNDVLCVR